jgi:hypothetical protein
MRLLIALITLAVATASSHAAESSALINKALDEKFDITIDKSLPEAMAAITAQSGVRLQADPVIWELLPWGRETRIQAKMQNHTLRAGLDAMTQKLGLRFELRDEHIELVPMPALRRLGQRASPDELRALDLLATRPLGLEGNQPTIKQLIEAVDLKLATEKDLAVENRIVDTIKQDKTVFVPRNATLMEALESLHKETRATWYPWGKFIVIVPKEDRVRRLLARPLTFRPGPNGIELGQLLLDLSQRTGVPVEMQPGILMALPPDVRSLRGPDGRPPVIENVPAQQILETIAAATGLQYTVQDDRVSITTGTAGPPRDRAVGMLQLDIGLQVLIPQSQVPADLQEYIKHKTQKEMAKWRLMMEEEKFKPSVPATRPAEPRGDL